jgi:hypothetical protein
MSIEELAILDDSVSRPFRLNDEEKEAWTKAFKIYNEANKENLTMRCAPCFGKVFQFVTLAKFSEMFSL